MKETVFRFELRVEPIGIEATLDTLKQKLAALKDVLSVESEGTGRGATVAVRVCFKDAENAKRLHRKVMNTIIGHEGVTVSQVMTRLTDIF